MRNKKSSEKKTLGPHDYTVEPYQTFKELTLILLKIFQKKKKPEEEILSYSFNKASLILKEKPEKDNIRKENYRPVSLMSTNAKFPNKILVHQIQQQIKRIINQDQVGIIPRRQG